MQNFSQILYNPPLIEILKQVGKGFHETKVFRNPPERIYIKIGKKLQENKRFPENFYKILRNSGDKS